MALNIHCEVIEVPVMTDMLDTHRTAPFHDFIPWADPYIAGLVDKLRQSEGRLLSDGAATMPNGNLRAEAPPPLDVESPRSDDGPFWGDDRSRRWR